MNVDAWFVRAVYVVLDDAVDIDELDQHVGGRVLHNGLGGTWSLPGQAERAQLECLAAQQARVGSMGEVAQTASRCDRPR